MFSPAKAITAGAIVFAIGGVMLVAQPFQQQDSVPGAEAPEPPVHVTGVGLGGPCRGDATEEEVGGVRMERGGYCNPSWYFADEPRLNGTVTRAISSDEYLEGSELRVWTVATSIVNADGAWRMEPEVSFNTPDVEAGALPSQFVLIGEGAYDGLYAVLGYSEGDRNIFDGYIVHGEVPPVNEAAAAQ